MRKLFILSALCLLCMTPVRASVVLDATNFPDAAFRTYISVLTGVGINKTISDEKIANVKEIIVSSLEITSLQGIEYFTELQKLDFSHNKLTSVSISANRKLKELAFYDNQLSSLDVSKNTMLEKIEFSGNEFTSLDISNLTALKILVCMTSKLTMLDLSKNISLEYLNCLGNNFATLDISKNTELSSLNCQKNNLTSLDVSNNTKLVTLQCDDNQLTLLDVSNNTKLEYLYCGDNNLTRLDVSKNIALKNISCGNNNLSALSVANNKELIVLNFNFNKVAQINLSNNTKLMYLFCAGNCLTYLNLDKCSLVAEATIGEQISTRRFQIMSNGSNENDCWALYVGTSDASRIKDLKIDGVETEPEMLKSEGWMVVSNDRKKIPLKVTYKIYTGNETAGWMDVTVNYDVRNYGVYVDGKELTSLNFYDIPGLKSGTAYLMDEPEGIGWSGYQPTLALSDAKIEGEEGIRNEQAYYLKIIVKGDNEVTATDYNAFANNTAGVETVFSGGGTVRFTATGDRWNGIYAIDSRMTLKEGTTVMAKGDGHGYFDDNSTLVMQENSKLIAYGNQYASVELPLADQRKWDANIGVRYPEGAYIGDRFHVFYAGTTKDVQKDWVLIGPEGATLPADLLGNPADVNKDGTVDSADIVAVIKEMPDGDKKADVNGDTVIDSADIVAVIKAMK